MSTPNTYKASGVSYETIDLFKIVAQNAARRTRSNIQDTLFCEVGWTRGESVYLLEGSDYYLGLTCEGLGTKNLIVDELPTDGIGSDYDIIAQDAVAMIVNDMATLGVRPLTVSMFFAVGHNTWFDDSLRAAALVSGWEGACAVSGCTWGGGETSVLLGNVEKTGSVLAGSGIGIIMPKNRVIKSDIEHGDAIVLLTSSGIHANGLTFARSIAKGLPQGYETTVVNEMSYGSMLMEPTHIYSPFIQAILDEGIIMHYIVNITGHGWRKLMRSLVNFTYVVETLPPELPLFSFIQKHGQVTDEEMYGTFNMGAGFAIFTPQHQVDRIVDLCRSRDEPFTAICAGHVECGERKVIIVPKNVEFLGNALKIRS